MKAIIALLLLSNFSAIKLFKEPKEEPNDKKIAGCPDCIKNPNAVNCRIGIDITHVNVFLWKSLYQYWLMKQICHHLNLLRKTKKPKEPLMLFNPINLLVLNSNSRRIYRKIQHLIKYWLKSHHLIKSIDSNQTCMKYKN